MRPDLGAEPRAEGQEEVTPSEEGRAEPEGTVGAATHDRPEGSDSGSRDGKGEGETGPEVGRISQSGPREPDESDGGHHRQDCELHAGQWHDRVLVQFDVATMNTGSPFTLCRRADAR